MKPIDLISIILLIPGLFLATAMYILIKRGKLKLVMWPRIFGISGGLYMFLSSMITSILLRPASEIVEYTITNFIWSLALGIVGYFGGRMLVRCLQNNK